MKQNLPTKDSLTTTAKTGVASLAIISLLSVASPTNVYAEDWRSSLTPQQLNRTYDEPFYNRHKAHKYKKRALRHKYKKYKKHHKKHKRARKFVPSYHNEGFISHDGYYSDHERYNGNNHY